MKDNSMNSLGQSPLSSGGTTSGSGGSSGGGWSSSSSFPTTNNNKETATPHPQILLLTSSSRRLRELEIELLASLSTSDAAIEELVHLWTTERDAAASACLLAMQSAASECSDGLVLEEAALRLMSEHYPEWAEPYARLATLLLYQGRVAEAVTMAERTVDLKPWHFEALQLAVLLSQQQQQQQKQSSNTHQRAKRLARRALPKLSDSVARHVWVDRAVAQAQQQFREAEISTRELNNRQKLRQYIFRREDIWQ